MSLFATETEHLSIYFFFALLVLSLASKRNFLSAAAGTALVSEFLSKAYEMPISLRISFALISLTALVIDDSKWRKHDKK